MRLYHHRASAALEELEDDAVNKFNSGEVRLPLVNYEGTRPRLYGPLMLLNPGSEASGL